VHERTQEIKNLRLRVEIVEAGIESAQLSIDHIDGQFCEPGFYEDNDEKAISSLTRERDTLQSEVDRLTAEWAQLSTQLEELAIPDDC